jgi:hypothetical protein
MGESSGTAAQSRTHKSLGRPSRFRTRSVIGEAPAGVSMSVGRSAPIAVFLQQRRDFRIVARRARADRVDLVDGE